MSNQRRKGETDIDRKYRELVFRFYLQGDIKTSCNGILKHEFACPFCSEFRKNASKKRAKCSSLYWVDPRNCYRFSCKNDTCEYKAEFPGFLEKLDPGLFREYQKERYHAGTTGGRWNCPHPPGVEEMMGTVPRRRPGADAL